MSANIDQNEVQPNSPFVFQKERSVVIVAGGCDASFNKELGKYSSLLTRAFRGYRGYIISGGTTAGIPGMVGDLSNPDGKITRVGYLPTILPSPEKQHPDYEFFRTADIDDFSNLDPLQAWSDLLASGVDPKKVRVLGINGGAIAAFEFRLGIIMGATVGVVGQSGRSASQICNDDHWSQDANLICLPEEAAAIRNFLQPAN